MMKNFTKILSFGMAWFLAGQISAQVTTTLVVTSPESIAGSYEANAAQFGNNDYTDFEGTLALAMDGEGTATDGCTAFTNDVSGKIAVVDRGECSFVQKAQNAIDAGASAMLLCNNQEGSVTMVGDLEADIPFVSITQADCQKIRAVFGDSDVTVRFERRAEECPREYDEAVFWGAEKGQGDFSEGLGDWTTVNLAPVDRDEVIWEIAEGKTPVFSSFFGSGHNFTAPTACNGHATFSFVKYAIADNPSPTQPYETYSAELISPIIDCTGKEYVTLEYFQAYNKLNNISKIAFSTDGGETWTKEIDASYEGTLNEVVDDRKISLPVPEFDGKANCRFKFIATGDFYYWSIDDVTLRAEEIRDIRLNSNWYAAPATAVSPKEFVDVIPFLVDVENIGNTTLDEVVVTVEVIKDGDVLYTATNPYGTVNAGTLVENVPFQEVYQPPSEEGVYTIRYTASCAGGDIDNNNVLETKLTVGGNVLSKMPVREDVEEPYFTSAWAFNESGNYYSWGNYYKFPKTKWDNGNDVILDKAYGFFSSNEDEVLGSVEAVAYAWKDTNGDRIANADELSETAVASARLLVNNENEGKDLVFDLLDINDGESKYVLDIDDGDGILIMLHGANNKEDGSWFYGAMNPEGAAFSPYNSGCSGTVFNSLSIDNYTHFGAVRTSKEYEESNFEEVTGLTWYVPLVVKDPLSVNDFNANIEINTYPNPAVNTLNIDLPESVVAEGTVVVKMYDAAGRKVVSRQYNASNTVNVNVSHLAAGTYSLKLQTKEGFTSTQVIVTK